MRREALRELMANAALAKAAVRVRAAATESALVRPRGSGTVNGGAAPPPAELPIPALRAPGPIRAWQARPADPPLLRRPAALPHSKRQRQRGGQALRALTCHLHRDLLSARVAGALPFVLALADCSGSTTASRRRSISHMHCQICGLRMMVIACHHG